jgi:hypothetical protein
MQTHRTRPPQALRLRRQLRRRLFQRRRQIRSSRPVHFRAHRLFVILSENCHPKQLEQGASLFYF